MIRSLPRAALFWILIGFAVLNFSIYRSVLKTPELAVTVLDVEKGRAILIDVPGSTTFLVDAGRDASILRALGRELPFYKRRFNGVFLTSVSSDTAGGIAHVTNRYAVPVIWRASKKGSRTLEEALAAGPNTEITELRKGARVALGSGAYMHVLWADTLVLDLYYGEKSLRIQPDLSSRVEKYLASAYRLPAPKLFISSSTPPGKYFLD